jgi:hypothetical protein
MNKDESLRPAFLGSVFACAAINFPPDAVSNPHKDHLNLAYGWCSITPLGRFDHKAGAHLVLPELKLVIEFPVGSTIFVPSAAFTHYNTTIQDGEMRGSITQFSAGGIFRWTAYGHQLKHEAEAACVQGKKWWDKGKGLYEVWPKEKVDVELDKGKEKQDQDTDNPDHEFIAPVELDPWISMTSSRDHSAKRTRKDSWVGEQSSNSKARGSEIVPRKKSRNCTFIAFS